ncbi:MAG: hypothetical protein HC872_08030 [Gammaproteobacteria bacterium]|nr:hypothetical protein [Gammaproteobacteria bacterium]
MFQQIPYACKVSGTSITDWSCAEGEIGVVENFKQVGPGSAWKNSGRYTAINGQIQPTIEMLEKRVMRWRLIDAGFQSTLTFGMRKVSNQAQLDQYLANKGGELDMDAVCGGFEVVQFEVASDGLTHGQAIAKTENYLQPGYRSDILFSLPEAGYYCVYDNKSTDNLNGNAKQTRLLAVIKADANPDSDGVAGSTAAEQTAFFDCTVEQRGQGCLSVGRGARCRSR